ncbi:MAG: hypothetical protein JKX75_10080 [Gammaproteobacteria bacterium]|nr:hypothetical protein [Gammaproteobacteria bacterium]
MSTSVNKYSGAWLTDIDDTLIRSGMCPDDKWIHSLVKFIRRLKAHNVLWAPVSGVALDKMGPRLLFRLPKDVLSHVIYYGGEGSAKSYYDDTTNQWRSSESFQRNFSDAQTLVLIGKQRFIEALKNQYSSVDCDENSCHYVKGSDVDEKFQHRITQAIAVLNASCYSDMPSLVDQMEVELKQAGFDPDKAETYFRGGAISWMMFGDVSVQKYNGDQETRTRNNINKFIRNKLLDIDFIQDIGDNGVHMPYLHATRGIKLVLMGNDKSRAVGDLMFEEGIKKDALLFVGNELFDGGNDYSIWRDHEITIMSVGVKEDAGVIDGGVQVEANQYWMDALTNKLDQGELWPELLRQLPMSALSVLIRAKIDIEKENAHKISDWHASMSEQVATDLLLALYIKHADTFKQTRERLLNVKNTQYQLVTKFAVLDKYHYDKARKIVKGLLGSCPAEVQKQDIKEKVKHKLLLEITCLLKVLLVDHLHCSAILVSTEFDKVDNLKTLRIATRKLIESSGIAEPALELERKNQLIISWNAHIDELVDNYFEDLNEWNNNVVRQNKLIATDPLVLNAGHTCSAESLCDYFHWLISRVDNYPHLKDLDKPTIVLVAGTSGVGKSTISRHISKTLGIPTAFSSDVASRSVVRETIAFLLGKEHAEQLFPEVIGSSFEKDDLEWFYAHSLMTMVGVTGNINRLIKEDISAVIDGVALIPGTLPEFLFEKANIVWVVVSVADRETHFKRLGTRSETGVERGGADRYRDQFSAIRHNHDRLVELAEKTSTLIVDNTGFINQIFDRVLHRVNNPIADRGLHVEDEIRDQIQRCLDERSTWDIQNVFSKNDET